MCNANKVSWPQHLETIKQMIANKCGNREMARHFGVQEKTMYATLKRYGLQIDQEAKRERLAESCRKMQQDTLDKRRATMKTKEHREKRRMLALKMWSNIEYSQKREEHLNRTFRNKEWQESIKESRREGFAKAVERMNAARNAKRAEAEALKAMTPFERQLWMVRNGKATVGINYNRRYK